MEEPAVTQGDLIRWSEALAGIARTGLGFTDSLYERERFEEVLKVAADIRAVSQHPPLPDSPDPAGPEGVLDGWLASVGSGVAGYVTPKVAVGAIVGNERGQLLLIRRSDSGAWLYPTGWADIGYSPSEVAVKEVGEETGIEVEPVRVVAVFDSLRFGARTVPFYSVVLHCRAVGGTLRGHPLETLDVGWFAEDELPRPLAGPERWQSLAFAAIRGESLEVVFDLPRPDVWRGLPPDGQLDVAARREEV